MLSIVLLSTPPDVSWFSLISDSQNKKSPLKKKTKQNCLWFAWPVKKLFSIIIITSRCGVPTLQSRCFCYFFNFRVRISRSDFSPFFIILNVYHFRAYLFFSGRAWTCYLQPVPCTLYSSNLFLFYFTFSLRFNFNLRFKKFSFLTDIYQLFLR